MWEMWRSELVACLSLCAFFHLLVNHWRTHAWLSHWILSFVTLNEKKLKHLRIYCKHPVYCLSFQSNRLSLSIRSVWPKAQTIKWLFAKEINVWMLFFLFHLHIFFVSSTFLTLCVAALEMNCFHTLWSALQPDYVSHIKIIKPLRKHESPEPKCIETHAGEHRGEGLFHLSRPSSKKLESYSIRGLWLLSAGHWLLIPTLRLATPTLAGCWSSHCCVFVLIITCDVRNTMGQAGSTGFVMQGSAAAKTQSWKRDRAERERGREGERKEQRGQGGGSHSKRPAIKTCHLTYWWSCQYRRMLGSQTLIKHTELYFEL